MKILHAFVGYLAITALPFHPFAFASPLAAIDDDGYVTSSFQVAETCQTVSKQIHAGDSSLIKFLPGDSDKSDILEACQGEAAEMLPIITVITAIAAAVVLSII